MAAPLTAWHPPGMEPPQSRPTVAKLRGIRLPARPPGQSAQHPLAILAQATAAPQGPMMGAGPLPMPAQGQPMGQPMGGPHGLPPDLWRLLGLG